MKTILLYLWGTAIRFWPVLLMMVMLIVFALFAITGCSEKPGRSNISVKARVARNMYSTAGVPNPDPTILPIEYHIEVDVTNNDGSVFVCDMIEANFYPKNGYALTQRTFGYDESKAETEHAYRSGGHIPIEFGPHKTETYIYATNGYTGNLLGDTNGRPLLFSIALYRGGKVVAGPFVAELPDIMDLPDYGQILVSGGEGWAMLPFRRLK